MLFNNIINVFIPPITMHLVVHPGIQNVVKICKRADKNRSSHKLKWNGWVKNSIYI